MHTSTQSGKKQQTANALTFIDILFLPNKYSKENELNGRIVKLLTESETKGLISYIDSNFEEDITENLPLQESINNWRLK